ncbi:MAG: DHH family phosphoesterase [Erysipelotrichaceae bacterium]|nr:DHH family phosphoesterase [Erysipelotrichaceae bacterium]
MKYEFLNEPETQFQDRVLSFLKIEDRDPDAYDAQAELPALKEFGRAFDTLQNERILLVGDYDCDGICSTNILVRLCEKRGYKANYYIPSRHKEGYGLNLAIVDNAIKYGFTALICLDNGVKANEAVQKAIDHGIKVLIIDHHEYEELPPLYAFLHPNLLEEGYDDCCTAGLSCLLYDLYEKDPLVHTYAGLATLADAVSVFGFNRFLIKEALNNLNTMAVEPLQALAPSRNYSCYDLSYQIIPKINAVARLENGANVNMLVKYLSSSGSDLYDFAGKLEKINEERKELTRRMMGYADDLLTGNDILYASDSRFEEGLCGIIAGRMVSLYQKPCLILSEKDGIYKGSARSLGEYPFFSKLLPIRDQFLTFGGHEAAFGVSFDEEHRDTILRYLDSLELDYEPVKTCLSLSPEDLTYENALFLAGLEPFGTDLVRPLFALHKPAVVREYRIKNRYPKWQFANGTEAVYFGEKDVSRFEYLIGYLEVDRYHKNRASFLVEDLI